MEDNGWLLAAPTRPGAYWFCGRIWGGPVELKVVELMPNGALAVYGQLAGVSNFDGIFCPIALPPHPEGEAARKIGELKAKVRK